MIDALLTRASTRFVFVVGKGGVGKSTTACALALSLADQSQRTHLISTDPAHSLRDVLDGQDCSSHLTVEEFDARKYADTFFRELREPFIDLIEHGTYLDAADAAGFVDLSIPGIDEVMAALRLVDLLKTDVTRVVVDTAPTGHTMRLLDSGITVESWVQAGRAMAEKAGAVASAMVGQQVTMTAEHLLNEWQQAAHDFDARVLREGSTIVVTREGKVVEAETKRFITDLKRRKLTIAAVLSVGSATPNSDFVVDSYENPKSCDGLRQWRDHVHTDTPKHAVHSHRHAHPHSHSHAVQTWLTDLPARVMWISGKGGVGKSTCAAAIAATLSNDRKICLVSTDPAGSLVEVLDAPIAAKPIEVAPNFFARQIDANEELRKMRGQYQASVDQVFASFGLSGTVQLDRRVMESLWDLAPPGIDEIISLIEIVESAPEYDTVIIDSAPTGHFLRLLELPEIALEWVHALLRALVKYGAVGSLDALAHDLLAFAKRLRLLKLQLSSRETTAVFVVTLAEPVVEAETARLSAALERTGIPVSAKILNRADDGLRAHEERLLLAPELDTEIVGVDALRSFLAHWEFAT